MGRPRTSWRVERIALCAICEGATREEAAAWPGSRCALLSVGWLSMVG